MSPAGANAWEKYQAVLALEPGHKIASAGLDSIIGRYVSKFETSLKRRDFSDAAGYLSRIESVYADAPVLSELSGRLSVARESALRAAKERLRQSKIAGYEGKFEEALGRNDFAMADRYVDSLRAVNADESMLSRLSDRLSSARESALQAAKERDRQSKIAGYEGKFEEALGRNNVAMADRYVESLRAVNADESMLSRLSGRLSGARAAGRRFRDCAKCPEMVVVPSGSFTMRSPNSEDSRYDDEGPRHRVTNRLSSGRGCV